MITQKIIVLVEEPSTEIVLEALFPKISPGICIEIRRFQCKNELLANLPKRLRAYRTWLPESSCILVMVDRDDEDCLALKQRLEKMAEDAGFFSKSRAGANNSFQIVNRIAIEELEAWFFGDWEAVRLAYPNVDKTTVRGAKFRDPDAIRGGTWEALERVLQKAGYFRTGLRKMECARAVAASMDPTRNTSKSFRAFLSAVSAIIQRT